MSRKFGQTCRALVRAVVGGAALVCCSISGQAQSSPELYEQAKKEGSVVVYINDSTELIGKLSSAFSARYPGVRVNFQALSSPQIIQRFEAELAAGRYVADLVAIVDSRLKAHADKGHLTAYVSPMAAAYEPGVQPSHGNWANIGFTIATLGYNTNLVKPSEVPKRWSDLLDPKWKGKIGMVDPKAGGAGGHSWAVTMYGVLGPEKWHDFMDQLGKQVGYYGGYYQVREALISGEVALHLPALIDQTEPMKHKGAPIDWANLDDAMFYLNKSMAISKHAPHPNAAKLFIDFLLSPEGQQIYADDNQIPALRSKRPAAIAALANDKLAPWNFADIYTEQLPISWFNQNFQKYFAVNRASK